MNTPLEVIIAAVLAAVLPGGLMLLNERRLRRISAGQLLLAKAATGADNLLLSGEPKLGELCHDYVCKVILETQHAKTFNVHWNPLSRVSSEHIRFHRLLEQELESNHGMRHMLDLYVRGFAKAFRNAHPIKCVLFSIWVMLCRGGLRVLIVALRSTEGILAARLKAKRLIAEWSVVFGYERQVCGSTAHMTFDSGMVRPARTVTAHIR